MVREEARRDGRRSTGDPGPLCCRRPVARSAFRFAARAAAERPELLTVAPLRADRHDRVYLGTRSNHVGIGSLLPYCICDDETGGLALPLGWDELDTLRNGDVTAATFAAYLAVHGDAFARERERIGAQSFGDRALTREAASSDALDAPAPSPKGYIIGTALAVLADGAAPDADDILAQALARGLLPGSTSRKYVYTALHEYVERTLGAGRVPEFVQVAGSGRSGSTVPPTPGPPSRCRPCPRGARQPRSMPRSRRCAQPRPAVIPPRSRSPSVPRSRCSDTSRSTSAAMAAPTASSPRRSAAPATARSSNARPRARARSSRIRGPRSPRNFAPTRTRRTRS